MIFPSAGAHKARQDRIKRDRDVARKADLAAMGMAAQQEIEVGMGSLPTAPCPVLWGTCTAR
jgi:hypothetical protein